MRPSSLPAVLLAVCCALLAGTVLRAFRVPVLTSAAAQTASHPGGVFPPFNSRRAAGLRPARPAERQAATSSIAAQLAAFTAGNYVRAMYFQSMSLRQNFVSLQDFRRMMETSYPQFLQARHVQFGPARAEVNGQHVLVPITFTGRDSIPVKATYIMVREGVPHKFVYRVEGVIGGMRPVTPPVLPGTGTDA